MLILNTAISHLWVGWHDHPGQLLWLWRTFALFFSWMLSPLEKSITFNILDPSMSLFPHESAFWCKIHMLMDLYMYTYIICVFTHGLLYKWNVIKIVKLRSSDFIVGKTQSLFQWVWTSHSFLDMVYEHFLCSLMKILFIFVWTMKIINMQSCVWPSIKSYDESSNYQEVGLEEQSGVWDWRFFQRSNCDCKHGICESCSSDRNVSVYHRA